jgi:hypothetical protein
MNTRSITILNKISDEYNLDKQQLIDKYINVNNTTHINNECLNDLHNNSDDDNTELHINQNVEHLIDENNNTQIKSNQKILDEIIDNNFRCIAVTRTGTRCKRSKRNADYCNIHLKKMNIP